MTWETFYDLEVVCAGSELVFNFLNSMLYSTSVSFRFHETFLPL